MSQYRKSFLMLLLQKRIFAPPPCARGKWGGGRLMFWKIPKWIAQEADYQPESCLTMAGEA